MADPKFHTSVANPPPPPPSTGTPPMHSGDIPKPRNMPPTKPVPPPATYVVQLPREQILRHPPPENATKFQAFTRRKNRRSCCCFALCLILLLIAAAAVCAAVLYLVFDFKSPMYTVTNISITQMNLTSVEPISPGIDVSIRADNPNGKVGIYYLKDSAVNVFFNGTELSNGVLPAFYQPEKNVTVMRTALTGSDVVLVAAVKTALRNGQNRRKVPLEVNVDAPVKMKVGSAKTWEITVKVRCDVVVDALNEKARIVSKDCDRSVRLW